MEFEEMTIEEFLAEDDEVGEDVSYNAPLDEVLRSGFVKARP